MTFRARIRPALADVLAVLGLGCLAVPAQGALPQLAGSVDLASARPNTVADGAARTDLTGASVAAAGDVNGDGLADVVVGAVQADPRGRSNAGTAFVVFGRGDGASVDLSRVANGGGFRIDGSASGDQLGGSVAGAGDVNGDGLADVVVGAGGAEHRGRGNAGAAYVVFGRRSTSPVDAASLGSNGFRIDGAAANDRAGTSVAGGRDVNGDGRPDVLVGAPQADHNGRANSGSVYAVFGQAGTDAVDLAALGTSGWAIDGAAAGDQLSSAALTVDQTGDGRADVLAGARLADPSGRLDAGAAYLVSAVGASVDLAEEGAAFYVAQGAVAGDLAGSAVAQGGDLNGDARPDILVGAPGGDSNGRAASGSAYVLLGVTAGGSHDLAALESAWRVDGAAAGDAAGTAVDAGGDIDSDGRVDLVVGSPLADRSGRTDSGSARVLYGGGFAGVVDLATTTAPGFRADGASGDWAGTAVALVGDANGDGRGDAVVGVPRSDHLGRGDSGSAHFLWGYGPSRFAYPDSIAGTVGQPVGPLGPQSIVRTGVPAFSISPALPTGLRLDPASGVISGSPAGIQEQPSTYTLTMTDFAGSVSVPVTLRVAPLPGACANVRNGTSDADRIDGTSGGDRIDGRDGDDVVQGLDGDDCVIGESASDTLHGGLGYDELHGGTEQDVLDGGAGADKLFGDEAPDKLAGGDGDDELHGGSEQDQLSGAGGADQLFGDVGQDILAGGDGADVVRGGVGFDEIEGGAGDDRLFGEDDSDVIEGGAGSDRVEGGASTDKLAGGGGADVLVGGGGNDILSDSSGATRIDAGSGSDWIRVRNGKRDRVACGKGTDHVSADRGDRLSGCEKVARAGGRRTGGRRR
jgi:Ca2+-binding RTX toxin-like protein